MSDLFTKLSEAVKAIDPTKPETITRNAARVRVVLDQIEAENRAKMENLRSELEKIRYQPFPNHK